MPGQPSALGLTPAACCDRVRWTVHDRDLHRCLLGPFDIFDFASISETFDTLTLPTLGPSLVWNVDELYTEGILRRTRRRLQRRRPS